MGKRSRKKLRTAINIDKNCERKVQQTIQEACVLLTIYFYKTYKNSQMLLENSNNIEVAKSWLFSVQEESSNKKIIRSVKEIGDTKK